MKKVLRRVAIALAIAATAGGIASGPAQAATPTTTQQSHVHSGVTSYADTGWGF